MKTTTLGWIVCASLAIGACNSSGTSGTGSTATATGTKPATVAETAREKAADALSAAREALARDCQRSRGRLTPRSAEEQTRCSSPEGTEQEMRE